MSSLHLPQRPADGVGGPLSVNRSSRPQARASITRLYGVAAATRAVGKPASVKAPVSRAGPAWAPSAAPPSETLCGTQSSELPT